MRFLQDRIEQRREVARRGVDYAQHLGDGRLLLQSLARLSNQSRILHRDHGLRREVLEQRNLLLGEWPNLLTTGGNHAEQHAVFAQRQIQPRAHSGVLDRRPDHRMVDLRQIGNVHEPFAVDQRSGERVVGTAVSPPQLPCERPRIRVCRHCAEDLAFAQHQRAVGDSTKLVRPFQHRVEHWREITGRRIDDVQYLGGGGLLLQSLACLSQ
jgi:hypothetical protein